MHFGSTLATRIFTKPGTWHCAAPLARQRIAHPERVQHKRRVVSPALAHDIHAALASDGELFVETDIFDIALEAMAVLETGGDDGRAPFVNAHEPWSFYPRNPFAARSRRERQCDAEGARIWRLLYRRIKSAS